MNYSNGDQTAIDIAEQYDHSEIFEYLTSLGAKPSLVIKPKEVKKQNLENGQAETVSLTDEEQLAKNSDQWCQLNNNWPEEMKKQAEEHRKEGNKKVELKDFEGAP